MFELFFQCKSINMGSYEKIKKIIRCWLSWPLPQNSQLSPIKNEELLNLSRSSRIEGWESQWHLHIMLDCQIDKAQKKMLRT